MSSITRAAKTPLQTKGTRCSSDAQQSLSYNIVENQTIFFK